VTPPSISGAEPPEASGKRYAYVWEFLVASHHEQEFLAAYGPSGAWASLFRRAPGYVETLLLRDQAAPGRFLTIDTWSSAHAHGAFRASFRAEYEALDRACEALTQHEASLGAYWEVAEVVDPAA
jgi:heme-degrading monooxygenase HmoA